MPIDLGREELLTISQAAKRCRGRPHVATVWRWVLNGLHGLKLASIKVGGRRYTSVEAIERFITATTAHADGKPMPTTTRKQRDRAFRQAEKELDEDGI